jgi:hypothetical protein
VQRLQTVTRLFPSSSLESGVEWFAAMAWQAGDARWRRLAQAAAPDEPTRTGKGPKELDLLDPATLMLRLRAGFGVGAKADLISFLIGVDSLGGATSGITGRDRSRGAPKSGIRTTTRVLAESVGYSRASVSRAVAEMSLARFIDVSSDRPPMYSLDVEAWAQVLRLHDTRGQTRSGDGAIVASNDVPRWQFSSHVFAFLLACQCWAEKASGEAVAETVQASRARDIVDRFGRHLSWAGLDVPDARAYVGEHYLEPFGRLVDDAIDLMDADGP